MARKPTGPVKAPSHTRLKEAVVRWRRQQAAGTVIDKAGDRHETPQATVFRQCANDLELILSDDLTLDK